MDLVGVRIVRLRDRTVMVSGRSIRGLNETKNSMGIFVDWA
jgi:hypothetical protein